MRDNAYQIVRALAATRPRDYFVIVQCTLVGRDGRKTSLLRERQERIAQGWKVE